MTDRFSIQLRRHLRESANERPADGQLAAVVDAVATTRQRLPLVARLSWNPGRIGLFPAGAVRLGLVAAALALAMVAGAMLAGGMGPTTVFDGTWTSTDPGDGSVQILVVGPGNTPAVYFEDGYATGPACRSDVVKRFTARGTGEISGSRLVVTFPDGGGCGLMTVEVAGVYDHLASRDMLVDQDGLGWTRVDGVLIGPATPPPATELPTTDAPATDAPATEPVPTQAAAEPSAAPVPNCLELDVGGAYRATAGDGLDVTVMVPAADGSWSGSRGLFNLVRAPCGDRAPVMIEASIVHEVFADACDMEGETRPVSRASEAIAALVAQEGHVLTGPTDATIAGLPASRFDISVPAEFDTTTCTNELIRLWIGTNDTGIGPGETMTVYIVDVDGLALAVHASFSQEGMTPALIAEVDGIIASIQIER